MSNINMVIVPAWLNLIQGELGIENADLAKEEKLCGILSTRDLLIYRMVNFQAADVFAALGEGDCGQGAQSCCSFNSPLSTPSLEERAMLANVPLSTLICGATQRPSTGMLLADVELVDSELIVVRLMSSENAPDNVRECTDSIGTKLTKVLHGRIPLDELAATTAFKQYVKAVQINPVFY